MRSTLSTLAILVLCAAVAGGAWGQDPVIGDASRQKQTLQDIRNVGTAFMAWLTDHAGSATTTSPAAAPEGQAPGWTIRAQEASEEMWYSAISHAAVSELLVPDYIAAVPEKNPWGHPYQFALNADLLGKHVLGIRSPGKDGVFEGDDYLIGSFFHHELDHDVVWCDGYFARWPTTEAPDRRWQPVRP